MRFQIASTIGPVLFLDAEQMRLSALFITPEGNAPTPPFVLEGDEVTPTCLARFDRAKVWRARFSLPAGRTSSYAWNGNTYQVAGDLTGDLRVAFVSCNGEEVGDMAREGSERNAMWARLRDEHRSSPFALMLHGGDQIYADEVTQGHDLSDDWGKLPPEPSRAALADLLYHLCEGFFDRYVAIYAAPEMAWLAARVPSLMQCDDHDICDGWESLRRSRTFSPVGQTLFAAAREGCLIFQHASTDSDLTAHFADPDGRHLG